MSAPGAPGETVNQSTTTGGSITQEPSLPNRSHPNGQESTANDADKDELRGINSQLVDDVEDIIMGSLGQMGAEPTPVSHLSTQMIAASTNPPVVASDNAPQSTNEGANPQIDDSVLNSMALASFAATGSNVNEEAQQKQLQEMYIAGFRAAAQVQHQQVLRENFESAKLATTAPSSAQSTSGIGAALNGSAGIHTTTATVEASTPQSRPEACTSLTPSLASLNILRSEQVPVIPGLGGPSSVMRTRSATAAAMASTTVPSDSPISASPTTSSTSSPGGGQTAATTTTRQFYYLYYYYVLCITSLNHSKHHFKLCRVIGEIQKRMHAS
mmetsp:Transcript_13690/g.20713  ORF Transcript_13690/g.20713 Transcript_13690/m.20713 type:complete len:328 (+) Transcript_13690:93-1076(+)